MPGESTEIDAHKSHVRRRISCEYVAFPGWQTILRAPCTIWTRRVGRKCEKI